MGQYDQNTLYKILEELVKLFFFKKENITERARRRGGRETGVEVYCMREETLRLPRLKS